MGSRPITSGSGLFIRGLGPLAALLLWAACAGGKPALGNPSQYCNPKSALALGQQDRTEQSSKYIDLIDQCPTESYAEAMRAYISGYGEAIPEQELPPVTPRAAMVNERMTFLQAKAGDFSQGQKVDSLNYLAPDGSRWTVRIQRRKFLLAPAGDWTRSHYDTTLYYRGADGSHQSVRIKHGSILSAKDGDEATLRRDGIAYRTWDSAISHAKLVPKRFEQDNRSPLQTRSKQSPHTIEEAEQQLEESVVLINEGKLAEAQSVLEPLLTTVTALVGEHDSHVAEVLNKLGVVYTSQGKYTQAESSLVRSFQIFNAEQGSESPAVGHLFNDIGQLHESRGEVKLARFHYEEGLRIRTHALGNNHPDVAASMVRLASLLLRSAFSARAEQLFQQALQIQERMLGEQDPQVAATLMNLAHLYYLGGAYDRAEPLQSRALRIYEQRLGPKSREVLLLLGAIAARTSNEGDYQGAEPILQRVVDSLTATQGRDQLLLAAKLAQLAWIKIQLRPRGLRDALGQPELLLQRAIAIADRFGWAEAARYRCTLTEVYVLQGNYRQAKELLKQCLAHQHGSVWMGSPRNLDGSHAAALLSRALGKWQDAASHTQAELRERQQRQSASDQDPGLAAAYQSLADLWALQGQNDAEVEALRKAFQLSERRLRNQGLALSERRLVQLLATLREQEERLYSHLLRRPDHKELRRLALATLLLRKGRSVDEVAFSAQLRSQIQGDADLKLYDDLRSLRSRIAHLALQTTDLTPPAQREQLLKELSAQAERIEQDLASRLAPLRQRREIAEPAQVVSQVAAALREDEVLVEFVAFTERPPEQKPEAPDGPLHYLALILAHDGEPAMIDLGPAILLEAVAVRLQAALSDPKATYLAAATDSYQRLFAPLLPAFGGRTRVVISADGVLDLVPFAALHDGQKFVIASHHISYVTSGRDLLRSDDKNGGSHSIVVVADPTFSGPVVAAASGTRGTAQRDRGMQLGELRPLPGTREEALAIEKLWPSAQLLLGPNASEGALLGLVAPSVLHIATHGIFMADSQSSAERRGRTPVRGFDSESVPLSTNPLLRSALVLAGAQEQFGATRAHNQVDDNPESDGVATALEVSGMNLWGTQLVVLSACNSGRGEVLPGQGVYGLRRAIQAAGAETLVTSLWRISDRVTVELMSRYYQALHANEGRVSALRSAALAVQAEHPHPYYWASFLALGRDGSLRNVH